MKTRGGEDGVGGGGLDLGLNRKKECKEGGMVIQWKDA